MLYQLNPSEVTNAALAKITGEKRLDDGEGLKLIANAKGEAGAHRWVYCGTVGGKRFEMGLGTLAKVSLAGARDKADAARKLVGAGTDPRAVKAEQKTAAALAVEDAYRERKGLEGRESFMKYCDEFAAKRFRGELDSDDQRKQSRWTQKTFDDFTNRVALNVYPVIGHKNVQAITVQDIYTILRTIEQRGALSEMKAVRLAIEPVFAKLAKQEVIARNPFDLFDADDFDEHVGGHHPAVNTAQELRGVLLAFAAFRAEGHMSGPDAIISRVAQKAQVHLFQRSDVITSLKWAWLDLDGKKGDLGEGAMLRVPYFEMKGNKKARARKGCHEVPLSPQMVAAFRELHAVTGGGVYCFPNARNPHAHMTGSALNNGMQSAMGRKRQGGKWLTWEAYQTAHGFRAVAATLGAKYIGLDGVVIKSIQGHIGGDKALGKAYERNEYQHLRRDCMVRYSNWLDLVQAGDVAAMTLPTVALTEAARNRAAAEELAALKASGELAEFRAWQARKAALPLVAEGQAANDARQEAA